MLTGGRMAKRWGRDVVINLESGRKKTSGEKDNVAERKRRGSGGSGEY